MSTERPHSPGSDHTARARPPMFAYAYGHCSRAGDRSGATVRVVHRGTVPNIRTACARRPMRPLSLPLGGNRAAFFNKALLYLLCNPFSLPDDALLFTPLPRGRSRARISRERTRLPLRPRTSTSSEGPSARPLPSTAPGTASVTRTPKSFFSASRARHGRGAVTSC